MLCVLRLDWMTDVSLYDQPLMTTRQLQRQSCHILFDVLLFCVFRVCLHRYSIFFAILSLVYARRSACFGSLFLSKSNSKPNSIVGVCVCVLLRLGQPCAGICVDLFISLRTIVFGQIFNMNTVPTSSTTAACVWAWVCANWLRCRCELHDVVFSTSLIQILAWHWMSF